MKVFYMAFIPACGGSSKIEIIKLFVINIHGNRYIIINLWNTHFINLYFSVPYLPKYHKSWFIPMWKFHCSLCFYDYHLYTNLLNPLIFIQITNMLTTFFLGSIRKGLNIVIKHVFICSNPYIYTTVVQEVYN